MMTPEAGLKLQQERIAALETALRGCLQQMQDVDMGRRSMEHWAMAYELAQQVLKRPEVIY
jgi:hypothetical protein